MIKIPNLVTLSIYKIKKLLIHKIIIIMNEKLKLVFKLVFKI